MSKTDPSDTSSSVSGWKRGEGWGWRWGEHDEVGALNATGPRTVLDALGGIRRGIVYDLGVTVDRNSFVATVHPKTEMLSFRTPEGAKRQQDIPMLDPATNTSALSFMSGLVLISDHAGTQIDGLAHITTGEDDHWYNGFRSSEWGGDFGPRKASADTTPPIIVQGVLADVASWKGVETLPDRYPISAADLEATLESQGTDIEPGDAVFIRTGTLRHWGDSGEDHERLRGPDASGLTLEAARWLVEQRGAILVGSDTSMVEVFPNVDGDSWHPVHEYLLVEQGVHMAELHYLEDLARERVYRFCYIALLPKIRGETAGFAMRPIALV